MRLSLCRPNPALMKKDSTNLTVAVSVVTKAREIVARMPFKTSVAQLAESILTEAFAAIEAAGEPQGPLPSITRLRQSIHGDIASRPITDEDLERVAGGTGGDSILATPSWKPGAFVGKNEIRLADFVRDIVDQALDERTARVAEPLPAYGEPPPLVPAKDKRPVRLPVVSPKSKNPRTG